MASAQLNAALRHIREIAAHHDVGDWSDSQLLMQFATQGNSGAFAALLQRHGAMVLRVCRRVLQHEQDAEDAFQATFLVLARRAAAIRKKEAVASWLHGVAHRVATNVKRAAARRRVHEERARARGSSGPDSDLAWREVQGVLDEEIHRLPEKHRIVFVLCYLEGQSHADVSRKLGVTKGVVAGRLAESRKRLRQRLARRGITLSVLLGAVALAQETRAAAVSLPLLQSTAVAALAFAAGEPLGAGIVSAHVAAIACAATRTMFTTKLMLAAGLVLVVSTVTAGAGALLQLPSSHGQSVTAATETNPAKARPTVAVSQAPAKGEQASPGGVSKDLTVRGRVLDPEGKPLAGATLYLRLPGSTSHALLALGTSERDGRFQGSIHVPEQAAKSAGDYPAQVVATAEGYGPDWAAVHKDEVTLRLVAETSLNGRLLNTDGKAVAGATVRLQSVERYPAADLTTHLDGVRNGSFAGVWESSIDYGNMKGWIGPLPKQPATLTTGADGRFRLTGFGTNEIVRLAFEGPTIQYVADIQATSRPGSGATWPRKDRNTRIYGPNFDFVAALSRPIRGLVRDKLTGRPIAGAVIRSYATTRGTQTDPEGRYELLGHPKATEYRVEVWPALGEPHFPADVTFADTPGFGPVTGDVDLVTGIPCTGRLIDRDTGRAVAGARVDYYALYPNANVRKLGARAAFPTAKTTTGSDGTFRLPVLPGPGALGFRASRSEGRYMPASISRADLRAVFGREADYGNGTDLRIAVTDNGFTVWGVSDFNALVLFNAPENASLFTRDAFVEVGRTVTGRVVGPDDKPVTGVMGFGLRAGASSYVEQDTFTLTQLNPKETRKLVFLHAKKGLGAVLKVRGDDKGPLTVRLKPCGAATGQFVNADGEPIADLAFECNEYLSNPTRTKTDRNGRFRVDCLIPGENYTVTRRINQPVAFFATCFGPFTVKSGEVKDLGQKKIKQER